MTDVQTAKDDFAFMRALVEGGESGQANFGWTYGWAGLLYGAQVFAQGAQAAGWWNPAPLVALAVVTLPTVLLVALLIGSSIVRRKAKVTNAVSKSVNTVFAAVGLSNLALVVVIGSVAYQEKSWTIWLVYGCAVLVLQGAAWLIAATLRRRWWQGAVAFGWFASGIAMAQVIHNIPLYCVIAACAMLAFMAAPGAILVATAKKA